MSTTRSVVTMLFLASMPFAANITCSQSFPNRPIRIVTTLPGGGSHFVARMISEGIAGPLGQPVIVESRGGVIPEKTVAGALPDGYTLLLASGSFVLGPLFDQTEVDPVRDFSPVIMTGSNPNVLVVHPSVPASSVTELIVVAKAKPGILNYGSGSMGSGAHLAAELFKSMAGVNLVQIPYKSTGPAVSGLIAGETQVMISSTNSVLPHVSSGKLRGLAVTSLKPSALAPGLPPIAASGLPGYEYIGFDAMFSPAKTPSSVIKQLNQEIARFLRTKETTDKLLNSGLEVVASSPEELGAKMKSEIVKWGKLMRDAGIKAKQ